MNENVKIYKILLTDFIKSDILKIEVSNLPKMEAKVFNDLLKEIKYDKSAIARIYEEYAPCVKMHLSSRFGESVDVDDITQDVFYKLMRIDLSKYREVKSPSAWLFKIAEHLAMDAIKKRRDDALDNFENIGTFDMDKIMIAKDVKAALSYLDPLTANIIYLNKYEGYTFKDIADLLSMSQIAVRVRASRGYNKLKKICNKFHLDFV